jgi:hypothetical protein
LDCQFVCRRQTQHLKTILLICYHDVCFRWRISPIGLASHIHWQKDVNLTTSYWHNELAASYFCSFYIWHFYCMWYFYLQDE